jgi:hypothetical protein
MGEDGSGWAGIVMMMEPETVAPYWGCDRLECGEGGLLAVGSG